MIILKDLLDVMFDITELEIQARNPDGVLIHSFYFADRNFHDVPFGIRDRIQMHETTFVSERINAYGKVKASGFTETVFNPDLKVIPKTLLDCEVTGFWDFTCRNGGRELDADISISELECETVRTNLQKKAYQI